MSRRPRGGLGPEDAALWRAVTRTVAPLKARPKPAPEEALGEELCPPPRRAPPAKPPHAPPQQRRSASAAQPADRGGERRIQRGQVEIHAKLDLHGHTQDGAKAALVRFLRAAASRGERSVIVVTGKGGRLIDGVASTGILRKRTPEWLASPELRGLVSGYAPAHRRHGGEGAYYVFLRASS